MPFAHTPQHPTLPLVPFFLFSNAGCFFRIPIFFCILGVFSRGGEKISGGCEGEKVRPLHLVIGEILEALLQILNRAPSVYWEEGMQGPLPAVPY